MALPLRGLKQALNERMNLCREFEGDFLQGAVESQSEQWIYNTVQLVWGWHHRSLLLHTMQVCAILPLVVRTTGLLVVSMKVLTAARKPTSSSKLTSTCGRQSHVFHYWWEALLASEASCFTSSNKMSEVGVLRRDVFWSGSEDEQPAVLLSGFRGGDSRSALAFTLKKLARVTAAWLGFWERPERPSFCAAFFFEVVQTFLGDSLFPVRENKTKLLSYYSRIWKVWEKAKIQYLIAQFSCDLFAKQGQLRRSQSTSSTEQQEV